jgi:hypothetical protein
MPAETPATGLSRRTVVKAAAWSVPVVALAVAAPSAAASGVGFDLTPAFGGPAINVPSDDTSFSIFTTITITNNGPQTSPDQAVVGLYYDTLLFAPTAQNPFPELIVGGSPGSYQFFLQPIAAGGTYVINFITAPQIAFFNLANGPHQSVFTATVLTGDNNTGNDTATYTSNIVIDQPIP